LLRYLHFPLGFYNPFLKTSGYLISDLFCCAVGIAVLPAGVVRDRSSVEVDVAMDPFGGAEVPGYN